MTSGQALHGLLSKAIIASDSVSGKPVTGHSSIHPVDNDWPEIPDSTDFQFTATELLDALRQLRAMKALKPDHIGLWEDGARAYYHFADRTSIETIYEQAA